MQLNIALVYLQVEQARFLVPPFTLGQAALDMSEANEQPAPQEQLPGTPEQAGGGTRSMLAHLRCLVLGLLCFLVVL